jgi:hypothetical protein
MLPVPLLLLIMLLLKRRVEHMSAAAEHEALMVTGAAGAEKNLRIMGD